VEPTNFNLIGVFATPCAHYLLLLSDDRCYCAPLPSTAVHESILEDLQKKGANIFCSPYLTMMNTWTALGCTVTGLEICHKKDVLEPIGHIRLMQRNDLGSNIVILEAYPADIVIEAVILNIGITITDDRIGSLVKDPSATEAEILAGMKMQIVAIEQKVGG